VTYTFSVKDECDNVLGSQSYTRSGGDKTAPVLSGTLPTGESGIDACSAPAGPGEADIAALYTDGCGGAITVEKTIGAQTVNVCGLSVTYHYTIKDQCGNYATAVDITYSGSDQTAPVLSGTPYSGTIGTNSCKANATTAAPFNAVNAAQGYTDNCGGALTAILTNTQVTGTDAGWTATYTFSIKDVCGNTLANQSYSNTGSDQTAPTISLVTVNQSCLWPPNHKMRDIVVTPVFADNCSSTTTGLTWIIKSVTSNEPVNGTGDGNTDPDWIIGSNKQSLQLRAEREGNGTGRVYTITVEAKDLAGNITTKTVDVIVAHNIYGPANGNSVKVGSTVNFGGHFWDVAGNRHTAKWLIDGSSSVSGTLTEPSGMKNGNVTGSYKFTTAGVYKLQMNITDQKGVTSYVNTNGDLQAMIVVYDPNGGYTFGSGSFTSPKGSVPSNPTATPKITFGFQSNYYKGATNPKGETEFDFDAGDFQFNALNFDYLVVDPNGYKAQFKGAGKISNQLGTIQSGINFIMTVIDGNAPNGGGIDKIHMKIYNKNTGQVYYDNQPNVSSDWDNPVTAIDGNIAIVNNNINYSPAARINTSVAPEVDVTPVSTYFDVKAYPNPTTSQFNVKLESPDSKTSMTIRVIDLFGKVIEMKRGLMAEQTFQLGANYRPGMYFIELTQGDKRRIVKVVKQPD
jgi:hypothetical protein